MEFAALKTAERPWMELDFRLVESKIYPMLTTEHHQRQVSLAKRE